MAGRVSFNPIPVGKPIKPGRRDRRVQAIAEAVRAVGYLQSPSMGQRYSGPLVAAVKQLQTEFGIKADGIIGDTTLEALNLGPAGRAPAGDRDGTLRWLQRDPPATRIDVNTAAASSIIGATAPTSTIAA